MPVSKCPNGKYRIGSGKCMFDSKEQAEKAYKAYLAKKHSSSKNEKTISLDELRVNIEKELDEMYDMLRVIDSLKVVINYFNGKKIREY